MRAKIAVGLLTVVRGAQTATLALKVQLSRGEAVPQHSSGDRNPVRPHKRFSIRSHPHGGASPL
jgi:hypothetical protein